MQSRVLEEMWLLNLFSCVFFFIIIIMKDYSLRRSAKGCVFTQILGEVKDWSRIKSHAQAAHGEKEWANKDFLS